MPAVLIFVRPYPINSIIPTDYKSRKEGYFLT